MTLHKMVLYVLIRLSAPLYMRYLKEYEETLENYITEKLTKDQPCYNCKEISWENLDAYSCYCKECGRGK